MRNPDLLVTMRLFSQTFSISLEEAAEAFDRMAAALAYGRTYYVRPDGQVTRIPGHRPLLHKGRAPRKGQFR